VAGLPYFAGSCVDFTYSSRSCFASTSPGVQLAHDGVAAVLLGGPRQRLAEVVVLVLAREAVQVM
jgi:hypothetical protein